MTQSTSLDWRKSIWTYQELVQCCSHTILGTYRKFMPGAETISIPHGNLLKIRADKAQKIWKWWFFAILTILKLAVKTKTARGVWPSHLVKRRSHTFNLTSLQFVVRMLIKLFNSFFGPKTKTELFTSPVPTSNHVEWMIPSQSCLRITNTSLYVNFTLFLFIVTFVDVMIYILWHWLYL